MTAGRGPALRALIVDDEPLARDRLRTLLASCDGVEVVGECGDGATARARLLEARPDVVFLDVHMPAGDGFSVLEGLAPQVTPAVVFVTAYDRFALRAFDHHAVDYLLKPYDADRFRAALARVRERVAARSRDDADQARVLEALATLRADRVAPRLALKADGRTVLVRPEEIDWVEAAGNHAVVHVGDETHVLRETLASLEARLDARRFVRIHRSTIVNVERIRELEPAGGGEWKVRLESGARLTLSRTHRDHVAALLGL